MDKGIDGRLTWKSGMTEKQWFDATLKCGDLPRDYDSWGKRPETAMGPCGAQNWRSIKPNLFAPWERALQCLKCGLWTLVTMPDKPEECQSCHYDTEALELYTHPFETPGVFKDLWLCELCAGSLAGNVARYFKVYDGDLRVITGCIMNAANHILAELRKSPVTDTDNKL